MHPIIFKIGSLTLTSYGLMLAVAIMVGIFIARKLGEKEDIPGADVESMAFWMVVLALIGARFLYTFVEHSDYYFKNPLEFFSFRKGGVSFFGGLFFAIATAIIYCRKKGRSFWQMADIVTPSVSLGLSLAKIGCFLAGCCHGKKCDLPWGIAFNHPETLAHPKGIPLHPTQLYESLSWLILFFLLLLLRKKRKHYGEVFLMFAVVFGIGRSILEIYRGNPGHLGTLTTAQMLSIPMVLLAIVFWILVRKGKVSQSTDVT